MEDSIGPVRTDGDSFTLVGIKGPSGYRDNGIVFSAVQYPYSDISQVESKSGLAVSTGDVHLMLWDGRVVTFNGFGEYVYLLSPSVVVQGRQQPPPLEKEKEKENGFPNCSSIPSGVLPTLLYAVAISVRTVEGTQVNISIFSGDKMPSVLYEINGETVYLAARQKVSVTLT